VLLTGGIVYAATAPGERPTTLGTIPGRRAPGLGAGQRSAPISAARVPRGTLPHSIQLDWILPGVVPTGKYVELPFVAIVQFENGKIAHEHLYWDQASVLVQLGLIDRSLPVRGGETAAQVQNPTQPMNELIQRAQTH
jgi:hypothetical protein